MAGVTKTSNVSVTVNTIIAEAQYTLQQKTVMLPLVRKYTMPKGANTINIPKFGTLTVQALTEGQALANPQTLSPTTQVSLTTSEVGGQVILTDRAVRNSSADIHRATGRMLGDAMAKKIDQDLLALFSSFTTHSLGGSSTTGSPGHLSAAYFLLKGQTEPGPDPIVGVFHPYSLKDFSDALSKTESTYLLTGNASSDVANKIITQGFQGVDKLFGLPIYASGNISTTSGSLNAIFSKESLIYCAEKEPTTETERKAALRGYEINHIAVYGTAVFQESFGVLITLDATAPTA